jgi:hypothetical protein
MTSAAQAWIRGEASEWLGRSIIALFVLLTVLPLAASAGGPEEDANEDLASDGPSYYGFVRDARGASVAAATVTLRGKTGAPVEAKTNVMGMYRTHVNKDTRPADVVLGCAKDGYRQVRVTRRGPVEPNAPRVQIDCVLQKG